MLVSLTTQERARFRALAKKLDREEKDLCRRLLMAAVKALERERWVDWPVRLKQPRD